jgi:P pilus assembly protein, pilin FimA
MAVEGTFLICIRYVLAKSGDYMNIKSLCLTGYLVILPLSPSVSAVDGTINFVGNILDTACTVDTASANQTVTLGNVASSSFTATGSTAAATRFTIVLTNCPATVTGASVRFDGAVSPANNTILALNAGQTATNVGIALYDQNNTTQIPIGTPSASVPVSTTAANTLTFFARYYATATPVGAGTANSTATFTITYN